MATVQFNGNSIPLAGPNRLEQAFGSNVGAGRTITVYVCHDFAATVTGVTDTLLNTYTLSDTLVDATNGERMSGYVAPCPTGGANTVTVALSAAPADGSIIIVESSGRNTTTPIRSGGHTTNVQATPGTGANGVTCGPVTATAGDDVLMFMTDIAVIVANTFTAGTNFTEQIEVGIGSGGQLDSMFESWDNHPGGSVTGLATQANNERTISLIVTLAAPGGGVVVKGSVNIVGQSVRRGSTW